MDMARLRRELSRGKGRPFVCLYGPETFLVEESLRDFIEALVPPEERELGVVRLYADECTVYEVLIEARTQPFFSQKRVVVVRRAEAWDGVFTARRKKAAQAEEAEEERPEEQRGKASAQGLLDYLADPNPSTHLVFVSARVDRRMPVVRKLDEMEALVECGTLGEKQALRWVLDRAGAVGCPLARQEAAMLVDHVGTDLQRLASEMGKLSEYMSQERVEASEAIGLLAAGGRERRSFELTDAVARQDAETALRRLEDLLTIGEGDGPVAPLMLLNFIAWQVRRVWSVRDSLQKGMSALDTYNRASKSPVKRMSRWHNERLAELKKTAERFSEADLMRILRRLLQADAELKGEGTSDRRTLEALVMDLCRTRQAEEAGP